MTKNGYIFKGTPVQRVPRSVIPLSYDWRGSFEMGKLIPIMAQEVLPGDKFKCNATALVRFTPLLAPMMQKCNVKIRYFFVPNRLIWDNWKDFITGGSDGTLEPAKPFFYSSDIYTEIENNSWKNSLLQCFGIGKTTKSPGEGEDGVNPVDAMPLIAYWLIWQEYYRDETFQTIEVTLAALKATNGHIAADADYEESPLNDVYTPLNEWFFHPVNKAWQKDYFTSALPWAQRGPQVTIPIGSNVPVSIPQQAIALQGASTLLPNDPMSLVFTANVPFGERLQIEPVQGNVGHGLLESNQKEPAPAYLKGISTALAQPLQGTVDLEHATGITINQLRLLEKTQQFWEHNAVGGGRYNEQILAHWNEMIPDYSIQRPVYLGGGSCPVQISEVLQTAAAESSGTTQPTAAGVGSLYGKAIAVSNKFGFRNKFQEHGWVIGLMSVMPTTAYYQGIPRKFTRFDKFDYAWPEFAHLGEQEVLNKELYADHTNPDGVFGYQSRFAEYKHNQDIIAGDFVDSLEFWHMARKFSNSPALSSQFIVSDPTDRIFATLSQNGVSHVQAWVSVDMSAIRKLPKYGIPKLS